MRAAAVATQAATLGSVRTSLTAVLLPLRNWAGASRVCALILDCFGHRISPVGYLFYRFFDAKVLKKVKASGAYILKFRAISR